jgi:predicted phage tail protein
MPLSEQEQRLLDEMERHLMGNDADVVTTDGTGRSLSYRNLVIGALLVVAGLGGIIAGIASQLIVIGVLGFVVMLGGVILAVTPMRSAPATPASEPRPHTAKQRASFMDRMNDRWDRRHQG